MSPITPRELEIDRHREHDEFAVTSWGEMARSRVPAVRASNAFALIDYRCPAGFGPPRHLHRNDDEVLYVISGMLALWTETKCGTAGPGDVVMLPKAVPHAWRSFGADDVHLLVIAAPGDFEPFFELLQGRQALSSEIEKLVAIADEAGMDVVGPPLSDEDVTAIIAERG